VKFTMTNIQKAITTAQRLLKKYNLHPPINVKQLIETMGITVIEIPFNNPGVSGCIKRSSKNGQPVIIVNKNHMETRKRFTLAHELAHAILHSTNDLHVDTEQIYFRDENSQLAEDIKEIQANQFAAELLMPKHLLTEDIKKETAKINIKEHLNIIIDKLKEKYNVSTEAMTIRIGNILY